MLKKLKRQKSKRKPKESEPVVTLDDMERLAKGIFDGADRKAGFDKRPGWKPRLST